MINFKHCFMAMAASFLLASGGACAAPLPDQIRVVAAAAAGASPDKTSLYDQRDWLERFYGARAYAPAWSGSGAASAAHALALLQKSAEHGLAPSEYAGDALRKLAAATGARSDSDAVRFDTGLTLAMLRYLADLHAGRSRAGFQAPKPDLRVRDYDPVAVLQRALAEQKLDAAVDAAVPQLDQYARLKLALAQQRLLVMQPFAALAPLPSERKSLKPGDAYEGATALAQRLVLLGDMPAEQAAGQDGSYGPRLVDAVKRFQRRHGLDADGNLGRQSWLALSVAPAARARQIELSMERLRWLPDMPAGPAIAINLPSFQLWAFESEAATMTPALQMRVIVGQAVKTPTPVFLGSMRYLEFNPYWNVPYSIQSKEIIPKLSKDLDYLEKNNMELVDAHGVASGASGADALAALRAGGMRVRQRPGALNALGAVKFGLPNEMDIYLHSTPTRALFQRARRDFSHGCIRVEDPLALAKFVLAGQAKWDAESIAAAMESGAPLQTVRLAKAVPVVVFYTTAIVDRDGRVVFADDMYRLDAALERALAARTAARN